jgi:asparagine synthase (glutamine-hydrolysing)
MSAIAGLISLDDRPVHRAAVMRMIHTMTHRGVGPVSVCGVGPAGLAECQDRDPGQNGHSDITHRVLKRYVVLADMRLDNRDEIYEVLGIAADEAKSFMDRHLIALLYDQYGDDCVSRLEGDFAFAVWDIPSRSLFCARDRFGIKPFYYYQDGSVFAFASELKAFAAIPNASLPVCEDRIADYLVGDLQDQQKTFYRTCHRLKPAHILKLGRAGLHSRSYWSLNPERAITGRSLKDCAAEFRFLFLEAVRRRLPEDGHVGAMLSGGLDSSSIVCAARLLLSSTTAAPLRTFSVVFENWPPSDERPYIGAVLNGGRLASDFIRAEELAPLDDFDTVWDAHEEPFHAPNLFLHNALYRKARERGVRILLDGLDGDLTVSHGIGYLVELARAGRLMALACEIDLLAKRFSRKRAGLLYRHVILPLMPHSVRCIVERLTAVSRAYRSDEYLLATDLLNRSTVREKRRTLLRASSYKTAREYHHRGLAHGFITFMMEVADRSAARCSIEPRYPFFDRRLVEFCLALPGQYKLCQGWTRVIMREALDQILPPAIRWRPDKADLSPAFIQGLLGRNKTQVEDLIHADPSAGSQYINRAYLAGLYARCTERAPTSKDLLTIWQGITLLSWLRRGRMRPIYQA